MMVSGIVLTSVGAAALAGGVAWGIASASCRNDLDERYPNQILAASAREEAEVCRAYATRSNILLVTSLVFAGAGIPLWAVGAKRVPATRVTLAPWLTPRAGGLSFGLSL
jgi:hypothetical protein